MLFKLTIPRDAQLVTTVQQVAERVAQCAGYTANDSARIASSVGRAVEAVLRQASDASIDNNQIEVRFEHTGSNLDVWLGCRITGQTPPVVDPTLSGDALRQGMDSVEFGREGDLAWCRLRRGLPVEKVDHKCDTPPEH